MTSRLYDVAIVGAGPGGLSAAARAAQRNMTYIVLEASETHANTIQLYQTGKHVMAEPGVLPLRSDMEFNAGTREAILGKWEKNIEQTRLKIRYQAEVRSITGSEGDFQIILDRGGSVRASNVVLALGTQGNPRKLGIQGEDLSFVQNTLESADTLQDNTIVVVGAGDSAIEGAVALARRNRVIIVNRGEEFGRAKKGNAVLIQRAIETTQVDCLYKTTVNRIEERNGDVPGRIYFDTPNGQESMECHHAARYGAATCVFRIHRGSVWLR